jgi:hypothetical protein
MKRLMLFLGLILLTGFIVGCNKTNKTIDTPCKLIDIPYQVTEDYQVPMKYEFVDAHINVRDGDLMAARDNDLWAVSTVVVRNVDSETGMFLVTQSLKTSRDPEINLSSSEYIMSGETRNFTEFYKITSSIGRTLSFSIHEPNKTLTRTVTKYRQEERCN